MTVDYCEANAAAGAARAACERWVDVGRSYNWGTDLGPMAGPPPLLAPLVGALLLLLVLLLLAAGVARGSARRRAMNETAPAGEQSTSTTPAGGAA